MLATAQAEVEETTWNASWTREPHLERCDCGEQILWYSYFAKRGTGTIKKPNGKDGAKRRFKCCCVCAEIEARPWRRQRACVS
jgi:hypothetical protein